MKPSTVLTKARKLIEKGWCKGPLAVDADGNEVDPSDVCARAFCAAGAQLRVWGGLSKGDDGFNSEVYLDRANKRVKHHPVTDDLSTTTKRQVLAGFDRAIKLAKSEGQ